VKPDLPGFFKHYAGGLWRRLGEHDVMFMAGALSFSILVCIVPFVLICFSIGGLILEKTTFTGEIEAFINVIVPYPETARYVREFVSAQVSEFRLYKNLAGGIGLVGLFFASSALFGNIRTIFRKIYPITRARSVLVGKLHDLGMILLVMMLFILAVALLPAVQILTRVAENTDFLQWLRFGQFKDLVVEGSSFLVIFIALFLVHLLVPATHPSKNTALVAAVSTAVLWLIAASLFSVYIVHIANFKRVYGVYALAIVAFFWVHYSSVVFIVGTEIGQLYRERHPKKRKGRPD
jgi:membrane protein